MRRIVLLLFISLLVCSPAYSADISSAKPAVYAEKQAGDVKVIMYMTTW